jgi:hypothetical protein
MKRTPMITPHLKAQHQAVDLLRGWRQLRKALQQGRSVAPTHEEPELIAQRAAAEGDEDDPGK